MKKTEIVQRDAPVLRKKAQLVPVADIKSKKIRDILSRMKKALRVEEDGVAIAAPQIGESLRIFVISGRAVAWSKGIKKIDKKKDIKDLVFINPEITKISKKKKKMDEGCLSARWLYGQVKRSEKATIKAYDETGRQFERGASGLLAQIFQHETDHLEGVLFTDKAENVRDMPPTRQNKIKFVFFGNLSADKIGSQFSTYALEELENAGLSPVLKITSAKEPLPIDKLKKIKADVFVVASFGKILPKEIIELPKYGSLNIHPSLLPELRGPAPIQNLILGKSQPGVTIIKMDEKMDHGPVLAQVAISLEPWPDHYRAVEEKLGRIGGMLLSELLPKWIDGEVPEIPQDEKTASYVKLIKKEDGLLDLNAPAEENLRKVLAYSTWPGAYIFFKKKTGDEIRVVIKNAKIEASQFIPTRVVPEGKREMNWQDFLRGNA